MSERIEITIDAQGNSNIDATGFKGDGCKKATADVEKALGNPTGTKLKPEYNQPNQQGTTQNQ
jgi:hypothetical protein